MQTYPLDVPMQALLSLLQSSRGSHGALLCPKVGFSGMIESRQRLLARSSHQDSDAEGFIVKLWRSQPETPESGEERGSRETNF